MISNNSSHITDVVRRLMLTVCEKENKAVEKRKLPKNWVLLERAYRAIQIQEDFIRNINEAKDSSPEEKLYLTNIVLKDMINGAKQAINEYYGKEYYKIK